MESSIIHSNSYNNNDDNEHYYVDVDIMTTKETSIPHSPTTMMITNSSPKQETQKAMPQSIRSFAPTEDNQSQHNHQQHPQQASFLTNEDLQTIQHLDEEYEKALIEREIGWNARYISVRQNAGLSLWFMFLYLTVGTIFFDQNTNWSIGESLLFSIYTITTVGYGRHVIPNSSGVLLFISFYIFLGIATLTIMAAQLYQWVVLEVTWQRYEHDKNEMTRRYEESVHASGDIENSNDNNHDNQHHIRPVLDLSEDGQVRVRKSCTAATLDQAVLLINKIQEFVKRYPSGQLIVVMIPFWFLILLGAIVIGSIEGWTFVESIYFSVVSLTTVGYGDYYPDKSASRWFCILWLPFSVFFVSLYLGSIASFYIKLSDINIKRIERKLRRRMERVRSIQEKEREEARVRGTSSGFDVPFDDGYTNNNGEYDGNSIEQQRTQPIPSHIKSQSKKRHRNNGFSTVSTADSFGDSSDHSPSRTRNRRHEILTNSGSVVTSASIDDNDSQRSEEMMKSMGDVITAIKLNRATPRRSTAEQSNLTQNDGHGNNNDLLNVHSTVHYNTEKGIAKKPSFALRVLVQERLAQIIALEVAGYQSNAEIKNNTLSVTIDTLKHTCEKWLLPKRATKNFRSVAFETLYFVGERQLIVKGANAVFELRPAEVQGLFGPVLAAMGDAGTMEGWLARTQRLAESELGNYGDDINYKLNLVDDRHLNQISTNITSDPKLNRNVIGNAFANNKN